MLGIISDTHGLVRPEALIALKGVEQILHAGDVGSPDVLERLCRIAPVTAVRGNVDRDPWASRLPVTQMVEWQGIWLYVLHDLHELDLDPVAADMRVVISGHSHQPSITTHGGVLYLNPGSAGPRRFNKPVTLARLHIEDGRPVAEIVDLEKL